jgi:hypothetical protein
LPWLRGSSRIDRFIAANPDLIEAASYDIRYLFQPSR